MSIASFTSRYLPPLEAEMQALVQTNEAPHAGLFGMLRYHLGWVDEAFRPQAAESGKRIRPLMCLLTCEACEGKWEQAIPAAAAIELLHNFSLIHDDIEDRDTTRRGRATLWTIWGEPQAINAGDALFSLAQLALLKTGQRGVDPATVIAAHTLFNETCVALTAGQFMDIGFETRQDVTVADYLTMISGKTAALAACACKMGALLAGAPDPRQRDLRAFGYHVGLAFQMRDDVLGVWGDPAVTGKPAGSDIGRRKKSLPILHGIEHSSELRALLGGDGELTDANVQHAVELLEGTSSREYAEALAAEHHTLALQALDQAAVSGEAGWSLYELAGLLASRQS